MTEKEIKTLEAFAAKIRYESVKEIATLGVGHIGGCMSIADILALLYGRVMNTSAGNKAVDRDRLIVSKGHSGPVVYATLALKGYFPMEMLATLNQPGTNLPSHCDRLHTPGIDFSTGSLGNGISLAAGSAAAAKVKGHKDYTYLILGDGECQEGQVWEAAMFSAQYKLDNLVAFVDNNHMQIDGMTADVNSLIDPAKKFESFGWYAQTVNGHDMEAMDTAIQNAHKQTGRPSVIVLETVKGKGCSFAEAAGTACHNMPISRELGERECARLKQICDELEKIRDSL